jgi:hypothetical protein
MAELSAGASDALGLPPGLELDWLGDEFAVAALPPFVACGAP